MEKARVFVSLTVADLERYRQQTRDAVLALEWTPEMQE